MASHLRLLTGAALAAVIALTSPARSQTAEPDRAAIEQIIRDYLLKNPELLLEAMQELEKKQTAMRQAIADRTIAQRRDEIFNDPDVPVAGNPKGDVTIVEFFDYHCGYCKQVHPVLKAVLAHDKNVRVMYREMPILSENSRFAAIAALAAARQGRYAEMHGALMEGRGQVTRDRLTQLASELKIDGKKLAKDMEDPKLLVLIEKNLELARALNVTGTPGFLIGNKIHPGALDIETMMRMVAEARGG